MSTASATPLGIDGIQWSIDGEQRIDLDIPVDKATFHERGGTGTVMRRIRPMSERAATELNLDPFSVQVARGGGELEPGLAAAVLHPAGQQADLANRLIYV